MLTNHVKIWWNSNIVNDSVDGAGVESNTTLFTASTQAPRVSGGGINNNNTKHLITIASIVK